MLQQRVCKQCGTSFPGGPHADYCPSCRDVRRKAQKREHKRKGAGRLLGGVDICERCGNEYIVNAGLQRFCPQCAPLQTAIRRPKKYRTCVICGKVAEGNKKTCSRECHKAYCSLNITGTFRPGNEKGWRNTAIAHTKIWEIKSPEGIVYHPYNLTQWLKRNEYMLPGTANQARSAFSMMNAGKLSSWHGWELLNCVKPDGEIKICEACSVWYTDTHTCSAKISNGYM